MTKRHKARTTLRATNYTFHPARMEATYRAANARIAPDKIAAARAAYLAKWGLK